MKHNIQVTKGRFWTYKTTNQPNLILLPDVSALCFFFHQYQFLAKIIMIKKLRNRCFLFTYCAEWHMSLFSVAATLYFFIRRTCQGVLWDANWSILCPLKIKACFVIIQIIKMLGCKKYIKALGYSFIKKSLLWSWNKKSNKGRVLTEEFKWCLGLLITANKFCKG